MDCLFGHVHGVAHLLPLRCGGSQVGLAHREFEVMHESRFGCSSAAPAVQRSCADPNGTCFVNNPHGAASDHGGPQDH